MANSSFKNCSSDHHRVLLPTLLTLSLLSVYPALTMANSGGYVISDNGQSTNYGNIDKLTDNNVIIDKSMTGNVYGALTFDNNRVVSGNTVNVKNADILSYSHNGETFAGYVVGGYAYVEDDKTAVSKADNNFVSISEGSTVKGNLYGGRARAYLYGNGSAFAQANDNSVSVSGGSDVDGYIYGSRVRAFVEGNGNVDAFADHNSVTVTETTDESDKIYGGRVLAYVLGSGTVNASADNNRVTISKSIMVPIEESEVYTVIYGGYVNTQRDEQENAGHVIAQADNNTINFFGSEVFGDLKGAYVNAYTAGETASAETNHNSVTISDSTFIGLLFGADARAQTSQGNVYTEASQNKVLISGSDIVGALTAGGTYIETAEGNAFAKADHNLISISDSLMIGNVYGGYAYAQATSGTTGAKANHNLISISDSRMTSNVYGGYAYAQATPGTTDAKANHNSVIVSNRTNLSGRIYGGFSANKNSSANVAKSSEGIATEANYNTLIVSDSSITGDDLFGGFTYAESTDAIIKAESSYNSFTVADNATVTGTIYGGSAGGIVNGNGAASAKSQNNTVVISSGAIVNGSIFGGYADVFVENGTGTEEASYNTVIVDNATVSGIMRSVNGVIAGGAVGVDSDEHHHAATFNTVNISGKYELNGVLLFGGFDKEHDSVTGQISSLNADLFTGNTLNLDAREQTGTTEVLVVANFETINLKAGHIENKDTILDAAYAASLGNGMDKGTTVNLISIGNSDLNANDQITLMSGVTGNLANDGQKHFTLIGDSLGVGYNGLVSLQDGDTSKNVVLEIEGKGANPKAKVLSESRAAQMAFLNSAADLLQDQDIHKAGKHVFGAVRVIYNTYKTGSSVDISGMGLVTGVANTWAGDGADLTGAVFVEAGWGSFDTKNSILGGVQRGDGDSYYFGTGVIGKYDVTQGLLSGLYAEAAAHVGIISTDYNNAGLANANGQTASYDSDSLYYAAHATAGYRWDVTDSLDVDVSATYLWNYLESQEVRIAADKFDFDSVQSHRVRVAAEVGYTADKGFRPYAGVAWEREFDGKAGGSVAGYRLDEADLGGNSGLAWAGVSFEPKEGGPIKADAEITTYFGQRKGVSGRVWLRYEF